MTLAPRLETHHPEELELHVRPPISEAAPGGTR
jgi:hypothetical protein